MLHNAFLVHDDIEDESDSRRGAPTLHRRVGIPLAVNAGDAMNALAMGLFRRTADRSAPQLLPRLLDEVDHMLLESLEGQALELGWMRDNSLDVGPEDYMRLVLKKTAWYSFIHPLRIGALVANPEDGALDRFNRFGFFLGLAFQISDDVLNLRGRLARYGKEIDGDLWEGKRTLILSHALANVGERDRTWMAGFLSRSRQRRLPREVFRLHELLETTGSIDWAVEIARSFAQVAVDEFEARAFTGAVDGPDLAWLRSCVAYMVQRDL
jgi:geranylgeranyl pyrophosphate synthase